MSEIQTNPKQILLVANDTTEKALRESEERFRMVADFTYDWEYWLAPDGHFIYMSPSCERITGHAASEFLHDPQLIGKIVHPDDREFFCRHFKAERTELPTASIDFRIITLEGNIRWIGHSCQAVYNADGQWLGQRASNRDISNYKRVEQALQQELFTAGPVVVFRQSASQHLAIEYVSPNITQFGYQPQDFTSRRIVSLVHPRDAERVAAEARFYRDNGAKFFEQDYRIIRADGETRWVYSFTVIVRNNQGNITHYDSYILDITERKHIEDALQKSEERYHLIFNHSPLGLMHFDQAGIIVDYNEKFAEIMGALLGFNMLLSLTDENMRMAVLAALSGNIGHYEGDYVPELSHQAVTIRATFSQIVSDKGKFLGGVGIFENITAQQQAKDDLKRRNHELALLNQASQAFNSTLDLASVLVTVLEGVRYLLKVIGVSIWLLDTETNLLICQQASGLGDEVVRGWRLQAGQGIVGWTITHGESVIVPDTEQDKRHFKGVDARIGLIPRSVLCVPLKTKAEVIGALEVVDTVINRFTPADLLLLESLTGTATIAIVNARLYEQAQRDAKTKEILLREVNHRIKNNLSTIIGLLYVEQRHAGIKNEADYKSVLEDLINRVDGIATVHNMLSASKWAPLRLSNLAEQIILSAFQIIPTDKTVAVTIAPSKVEVTPKQANNLALVINELATNSLKYALVAREAVQITVEISLQDGEIYFHYQDDGPGYPLETLQNEHYNVGMYLIQNIVQDGLKGQVSIFNQAGAVTLIRFKPS